MLKLKYLLFTLFIIGLFVSCGNPQNSQNEPDNTSETPTDTEDTEDQSEITEKTEAPCQTGLSLTALFDCENNKISDNNTDSPDISWALPSSRKEGDKRFSGIGRFGSCTASLLEAGTVTNEETPAYVLTNGHCIRYQGGLLPGEGKFFNLESTRSMIFGYYHDSESLSRLNYEADSVLYASMDETDIALIKLKGVTLEELKSLGLETYQISSKIPAINTAVENIGLPASGLSQVILRWSRCLLEEQLSLREGVYRFTNSYALKCNVLGGSSGSAVFDEETKEIVGLINTTVNDSSEGSSDCSLNRPCEVNEDEEVQVNTMRNYMQPTKYLSGCFTENGVFDKDLDSCSLSSS